MSLAIDGRRIGTRASEIDPDEMDRILAEGATLPAIFYTDPGLAELEDELIFRPSWQILGVEPELRNVGDYFTSEIVGATFTVPIVVFRDEEMQLRAFVNVCRHGGHVICVGDGNRQSIECSYDGWVYDLSGRLRSVPRSNEGGLPPFEELGLHILAVESWKGYIFVSVAPRQTLAEALGEFPKVLEEAHFPFPFAPENVDKDFEYRRSVAEYPVDANWKVAVENAVECYHCPTTHTHSFSSVYKVDPEYYSHREFDRGVYHSSWYQDDVAAKLNVEGGREEPEYRFNWLFPSMTMSGGRSAHYRAGFTQRSPTSVHTSVQINTYYAMPGADGYYASAEIEAEINEAGRLTAEEDREVSARVQRGLRSGMYTYGYTLPESERNMRHVYKLVWEALAPAFRS